MFLRLLGAPYCRRQYGLYRPISPCGAQYGLFFFESPYFAIAQYGLWRGYVLVSLRAYATLFIALFRPAGLNTGSGAAMCSFHSAHTPRFFRAIERYRASRRQGYRISFFR